MERITEYHNGVPTIPHSKLVDACWKLADLEDLEEQNRLFALPVAIGGSVYEVVSDDRFEPYIEEYEVTDVSVKGVKYAGDWASWEYSNLYTSREDAEKALEDLKEMERMFDE